ncbi:hypothetical protein D9M68_663140 [compost metagenome]
MRRSGYIPLLLALLGATVFPSITFWRVQQSVQVAESQLQDRVVISAPVLIALYGGDRFLAANLETMRLAATGIDNGQADAGYLIRAQRVVSELNACQEDNYYLANGLLTWSGAVREGNEILLRAMDCRFWDGIPPFFYGINRSFFDRDIDEAVRALELAAQRWAENAAPLRKLAIMLRAENFADERLALQYLERQRDSSRDPKLRDMLDQRVLRLQGLVDLRAAQRRYEQAHGVLTDLHQLVTFGEMRALPEDPLGLGYELLHGRIELKKLKIAGMEDQP